ncbi:NAD(P)-binding protein [Colletotrichum zoysiae]|uniref:NAD(P)-binding protein n=1 Tax=Colletotrichum zoysiae TaxID=1216348 RepID=A0AAD9M163_9PEZI|nr:NAD(P)-binding protein [Colletotrichum zoysiae]
MTLKIFHTGVTGYIGGDAFYALYEKHPEHEYTLLVRNEERAAPVKKAYPKVRIVIGSLNDADVIEKEAAAADVVVHTADSADDEPSAKAIAKGLAAGHSPEKPGFWIHVSGTGMLQWYDDKHKRYGEAPLPEQEYHDIRDIDRILNFPDEALHRNVDKIVLAANSPAVRIAVVAPPTIYGTGRGPINRRSIQVPALAQATLEKGFAPVIPPGKTEWDNVHVHDLARFFVTLVEATQDGSKNADPEIFGPRAYYFVESGTHVWSQVAKQIADEAHKQGYLPAPLTKEVTMKEALQCDGVSNNSWGLNSKSKAERARKYFGWEAKEKSLQEDIPELVSLEAKRLSLEPHKKQ